MKPMKTKVVRLYGKNDIRLETVELPAITDDELLVKIVANGVCVTNHKEVIFGAGHRRVENKSPNVPVVTGHELCGEVLAVGKNLQEKVNVGERFCVQPSLLFSNIVEDPKMSFPYYGGDATYAIIPKQVFELDSYIKLEDEPYYFGSLTEPYSCIIAAFRSNYHMRQDGKTHRMGTVDGGNMLILAGGGMSGTAAVDYALHGDIYPSLLVVTDVDDDALMRIRELFPPDYAKSLGTDLYYVNMEETNEKQILSLSGGEGYDDVFVFVPVQPIVEAGGRLLAKDGCLNFYAEPVSRSFQAHINFFDVHYKGTHICSNFGGSVQDSERVLKLFNEKKLHPEYLITHIGGLDCVPDVLVSFSNIPGTKKLIYNHVNMPLTPISEFHNLGKTNGAFSELARLVEAGGGFWNAAAEEYLLSHIDVFEK